MKKAIILVSVILVSVFFLSTCDKSRKVEVIVSSFASLTSAEADPFKNMFDSDTIVNITTADGVKLKAALAKKEVKTFPFKAWARVYPSGFAFIK